MCCAGSTRTVGCAAGALAANGTGAPTPLSESDDAESDCTRDCDCGGGGGSSGTEGHTPCDPVTPSAEPRPRFPRAADDDDCRSLTGESAADPVGLPRPRVEWCRRDRDRVGDAPASPDSTGARALTDDDFRVFTGDALSRRRPDGDRDTGCGCECGCGSGDCTVAGPCFTCDGTVSAPLPD